jgi:dTMP kinase
LLGKFIVFEGIDGSGSSTQARLLYDYLILNSKKTILTSEPSVGPIGNLIREIHTLRVNISDDRDIREKLLSYLFAADRYDHLYNSINGILTKLNEGYYVISTRYFLSSFAYHVVKEDDYESIHLLNEKFPLPDHTFYLDCPVRCSLDRISSSRMPDLNEEESNLNRVSKNYAKAISEYKGILSIIDGTLNPKIIHNQILDLLTKKGILQ